MVIHYMGKGTKKFAQTHVLQAYNYEKTNNATTRPLTFCHIITSSESLILRRRKTGQKYAKYYIIDNQIAIFLLIKKGHFFRCEKQIFLLREKDFHAASIKNSCSMNLKLVLHEFS